MRMDQSDTALWISRSHKWTAIRSFNLTYRRIGDARVRDRRDESFGRIEARHLLTSSRDAERR